MCRHLEMDDTGGVYARLQLPLWPQQSAQALAGLARQYWSKAANISNIIQKVGLCHLKLLRLNTRAELLGPEMSGVHAPV